jgi:hypothetical protein
VLISCVFVYVRLTQHTCKYIYPIQCYMFRLSWSHHQAFLEHKTYNYCVGVHMGSQCYKCWCVHGIPVLQVLLCTWDSSVTSVVVHMGSQCYKCWCAHGIPLLQVLLCTWDPSVTSVGVHVGSQCYKCWCARGIPVLQVLQKQFKIGLERKNKLHSCKPTLKLCSVPWDTTCTPTQ